MKNISLIIVITATILILAILVILFPSPTYLEALG